MSAAAIQRPRRRRSVWPAIIGLYTFVACLFLLAPIVIVLLSSLTASDYVSFPPPGWSLRWYVEVWQSSDFVDSLLVSLQIAVMVSVVSTVIGVLAALAIVRYRFPGRDLLNGMFLSPLVLPGIVLGVAILQFYAATGLTSSLMSLMLGHIVISTPYTIRLAIASLSGFDRRLELAAQNLGATKLVAFARITLPNVLPGVVGGAAFAFIVSFEDVNVALFLSSAQTMTLPVRIYTYLSQESSPIISAAGSLLTIIVVIVALVIDRLVGLRQAFGK